jgi:hypothetical protein
VNGEYYAPVDHMIVHLEEAQQLVDRYPKDSKVQVAADPAHPDKAFVIGLLE